MKIIFLTDPIFLYAQKDDFSNLEGQSKAAQGVSHFGLAGVILLVMVVLYV